MRGITDWLQNRSLISPDRIALINAEENMTLTYKELEESSSKWANYLHLNGVQKGDRVAFISINTEKCFEILFACGKIGAIFVPINWRLSSAEIEYILEDCSPKFVFLHSNFQELEKGLKQKWNTSFFQTTNVATVPEQLLIETEIDSKDPWTIIYTGGTTGKPKGAILSHLSMNVNAWNTIVSWNLNEEDKTITYLPTFHTGGLNALSLPLLMIGGTVVISKQFDPISATHYINEYGCTILLLVPTMYHVLIHEAVFQNTHFPTMKVFLSGGAPCPYDIYDYFREKEISFKEGYGLTEAGPNNFYIHPVHAQNKRGSVGKAMMFNKVKIIKENGKEARVGEVGELLLKGEHLFKQYWNNPHETDKALQDGWLHTGDLAKYDHNGDYYIVGRKKEMIISGGENIYPQELEHWICEKESVEECAVVGLPDSKWGEIVTAVIVRKSGFDITADAILEHCLKRFGKYKVPKNIIFVSEIPKTDIGKMNKQALILQYQR